MFIVSTILLPLVMSLFGIVPAIILNIKTPPVRVAVVDQTGKMYAQLQQALSMATKQTRERRHRQIKRITDAVSASEDFVLEEVSATNRPLSKSRNTWTSD